MATTASLTSVFNDSGQYSDSGTNVTKTSTQVTIVGDTAYRHVYSVSQVLDFTGSYLSCRFNPTTGAGRQYFMYVEANNFASPSSNYRFQIDGTTLLAYKVDAGSSTEIATTTYNATTHAYLRIRENSGTVYFDTSSDGGSWSNFTSTTNASWDISTTSVRFTAGRFSGTDGTLVVSEVNGSAVFAPAENAAGTATANAPSVVTGSTANAEVASGIATTNAPTAKVSPTPSVGAGTGTAYIALTYEPIPISSLTTAMNDTDQYSSSSGITRTATDANLLATTEYKHLWSNDASLSLMDSSLSAKLTPATGTGRQYFMVVELENFDGNNQLRFQLDNTTLYAYSVDGGTTTEVDSDTYNASTHAWWRIRHDSGTGLVYWEVSSDGASWSTFGSIATPSWNINSVGARWIAGRFSGTDGSMLVEFVNVGSESSPDAESASGVATGNTAHTKITPHAEAPAGTAVGQSPAPKVAPTAGAPGGVAQSEQPTTKISTNVTALTADASVPTSSVRISVPTSQGTGQGTANDPKPSVGPHPPEGAATGTAYQPTTTIRASAQVATGAGTAYDITPDNDAPAGIGLGTASALDPDVSISPNVTAEVASGASVTTDPHATVRTHADVAGGSAPGLDAKPSVKPSAGIPGGSAVSHDPTSRVKPTSEVASGVATTNNGAAHVAPSATLPVGSATALDSGARVGPTPDTASGAGTAQVSGASASPHADLATGAGSAADAQVFTSVGPEAGSASGLGDAFDARALTVDDAAVPPARPSGWEQWAAIVAEGRQMVAYDRAQPPISCPQCGGQLDSLNETQHCSFDGWLSRS